MLGGENEENFGAVGQQREKEEIEERGMWGLDGSLQPDWENDKDSLSLGFLNSRFKLFVLVAYQNHLREFLKT